MVSLKMLPVLTGKSAKIFLAQIEANEKNKDRIDFSKEIASAREILAKSKLYEQWKNS